jgi:hypothetical protein
MRNIKQLEKIAYECNITGEALENKLSKEEMYDYMHHTEGENNMKLNTMLPKEEYIKQQNAQRALNKAQYIDALKHVNNWKDFYKITKTVDPILTSENKKKYYFFPQGGMKEYWQTRKEKAAQLSAAKQKYTSNEYLAKLKENTYEENLKERERVQSDGTISQQLKQQLTKTIDELIIDNYFKTQEIDTNSELESSEAA